MTVAPIDIGLIIGYMAIVLGLGILSARKQTPNEYLIHGRSLTTFQMVATISASWVGGGAIVAYGAYVYQYGIAALSVYIGVFLNMLFFAYFAPRIRRRAKELGHLTFADYFCDTVGKNAGMVAAIVTFIAYMLFLTNQFIAGSTVLSTLSGWSYDLSLFISATVVLLYLLLGGMRSVVKTDVFQYFTMILLIVILGIGMLSQTGVDRSLLNPVSMPPGLAITFILYGLFIPFSSVEIWQRIFAAKDDTAVRKGVAGAGVCILILGCAITMLGIAAKTAYPSIHPNEAIVYGMAHLLPTGLLGLGLVVLFAAIMSTVDTIVFYLSSSVAKDFFSRYPQFTEEKDLQRVTRWSIVIVTVVGICISYFFRDILTVIITVAGMVSGVVPAVIGSFFVRLKENAVIASLISGCVYVLVLILTGNIEPDLAVGSLPIATVVLIGWQKLGR